MIRCDITDAMKDGGSVSHRFFIGEEMMRVSITQAKPGEGEPPEIAWADGVVVEGAEEFDGLFVAYVHDKAA